MLGTVDDGVKKDFMTASRAILVTTQRKRDGVRTRASRVKVVTAQSRNTHDGVNFGSRQFENFLGGEMTASEFSS